MSRESSGKRLVLLCHHGGWDRLYQAASASATAASMGWRVHVILYFDALAKWVDERIDEVTLDPPDVERQRQLEARIEENTTRGCSQLFTTARETGQTSILACSASVALLGHDPADLEGRVDAIVGWPTTMELIDRADQALYL